MKHTNHLVKITRDDNGENIKYAKWCLAVNRAGGWQSLCSGQFFGMGESDCEYQEKRGRVTCPNCIEQIKEIKRVTIESTPLTRNSHDRDRTKNIHTLLEAR